jgi:methionine-gamma-lyase
MSDDIDTKAVHPKERRGHGPIVEPIHVSSTWRLEDADEGAKFAHSTAPAEYYTRWGNPTTRDLELALATIEGGTAAIATSSGMGAVSSAVMTFVRPGANVIAGKSLYAATTEMFAGYLPQFGVRTVFVDSTVEEAFLKAVNSETCLVYAESPTNPMMELADLREAAEAARKVGAPLIVDNTFATPVNQRPFDLGADVVIHSATKYLGGHADVIAGAVITKDDETYRKIWDTYKLFGPTLGPFEAFLVRRGLKTLPLRVRRQNETALALAEFLERHEAISKVHYPGLKSFPQYALARKQMRGFGGMLSFEIRGGYDAAVRFVEGVRLASLAVSLGATETLVEHAASMTHATLSAEEKRSAGINERLIRVSVGLEAASDLIEDFRKALRIAAQDSG